VDHFEIDPFRKECLLAGIDEIDLTLRHEVEIARYEEHRRRERPWLG
jgi:3-isopropylmalate dehydratase small subunit